MLLSFLYEFATFSELTVIFKLIFLFFISKFIPKKENTNEEN
jgi:hypothetical protein